MLSITEENYLKAIFKLTWENSKAETGTNDLAKEVNVKPATATNMLGKLKEKKLIEYEKYGKSSLTKKGKLIAIEVIRKHRLWETFLFEKLNFSWDEVHEVAEQLEHIKSAKLIDRLDKFLNYPKVDPHGDIIPQAFGDLKIPVKRSLNEIAEGVVCKIIGVTNNTPEFLQYVDKIGLSINKKIKVIARQPFDQILEIEVKGKKTIISHLFAQNILIEEEKKGI